MGIGSLTLACMLLTATPGVEPEVNYWNRLKMAIPIVVDPKKRDIVTDLDLYCSKDGGEWKQVAHATPDKTSFAFTAPSDGKYAFIIQTTFQDHTKDPRDPAAAPIGQIIVVDTLKPQVKLKAERKNEEIAIAWQVTEENPNPTSFVVEYHLADQPSYLWTPLAALPGKGSGTTTIKPAPVAALTVRLRVKDLAENEGEGVVDVPAASVAALPPVQEGPRPDPWAMPSANSIPHNNGVAQTALTGPPPLAPSPAAVAPSPLRGALPARLLINKADVKLDFDVNNLGPSGFGTVDVYVTNDEGGHWTLLPADPGSIQPPEARGYGQARGAVSVHVPVDKKVFGYYLIVKSRANLSKEPPHTGDLPQIRLERDMEAPKAKLESANPDPTRHDTLLLKWTAEDTNLTDRPITLEWSSRPDGGWEFIGGPDLPNTGSFAWQVPPAAAAATSVYLKMTVHDAAGNITVAQTEKPVLVDMNVPEVAGVSLSVGH